MNNSTRIRDHLGWMLVIHYLVCLFGDVSGIFILPTLLTATIPFLITDMSRSHAMMLRVIGVPFCVGGLAVASTPLLLMLLMEEQGTAQKPVQWIMAIVKEMREALDKADIPVLSPVFGYNSTEIFDPYVDEMRDSIRKLLESVKTGFATEMVYLREPGISNAPVPLQSNVGKVPDHIHEKFEKAARMYKNLVVVMVIGMSTLLIGVPGTIMSALLFTLIYYQDEPGITRTGVMGNKFKDGVYRVTNTLFGIELTRGVATCHGGVLHVPYHVSHGNRILYGAGSFQPYLVDIEGDLTTYGGPPCFATYEEGDQAYANCETDDTRVSYRVELEVDDLNGSTAWPSVTKPGESGSPLYAMRGEELILLGLCGRYYQEASGTPFEFFKPTVKENMQDNLSRVVTYPGSGKTRRILPKLIMENEPRLRGKRILVTGPTRVVCREIYDSLSKRHDVGLNIKGGLNANPRANIQIAAHRSALSMLMKQTQQVKNLGMIIIDEAHVDDVATKLLRKLVRHMADNGVLVVEMSATLDGVCDSGSNHHIIDEEMREGKTVEKAIEHLEKGERVLIFVPGVASKATNEILTKLKEYKPIILSRATFDSAMATIGDTERRLIISTDIAECGINIPDLDVVIDESRRFTFVQTGSFVEGQTIPIDEASRTQRRGRVGRSKAGKYYYTLRPQKNYHKTSADFDSDVLATGRSWSGGQSNSWGISLTDKQFDVWMETDYPPLWIYLAYGKGGLPLQGESLRNNIMENRKGSNRYNGCRTPNCKACVGDYERYDERLHELLYSVRQYELY